MEEPNKTEPQDFTTIQKMVIDESKVIQTIVFGSDWQDVLTTLVSEENMDPLDLDLLKLTDTFMDYLQKLERFDFRIPARFILVAAILLRMKTDLLLEEEEKKQLRQGEQLPPLNIDDVPLLLPPMMRQPTKQVTLEDLIGALNKAFEFKERKETKNFRMKRAIEKLIEPEVDIEARIESVLAKIMLKHKMLFSELVPEWKRKNIVETLLPLLYLTMRSKVTCDQEEMFQDIIINLIEG